MVKLHAKCQNEVCASVVQMSLIYCKDYYKLGQKVSDLLIVKYLYYSTYDASYLFLLIKA
jgi:hypothetical protein